jgi:hypothetical protein
VGTEAERGEGKGGSIRCDAVSCGGASTTQFHPDQLVPDRHELFLTSTVVVGRRKKTTPKCEHLCDEGEEQDATHHCDECESYLCDSCNTLHAKPKGTRDHAVQTVAEFVSSGGGIAKDGGAAGRMCITHPGKSLEVYCYSCKMLICLKVRAVGGIMCVRARARTRFGRSIIMMQ